jgi:hypothetical protein
LESQPAKEERQDHETCIKVTGAYKALAAEDPHPNIYQQNGNSPRSNRMKDGCQTGIFMIGYPGGSEQSLDPLTCHFTSFQVDYKTGDILTNIQCR